MLFNTLREFENLPLADLSQCAGLKSVAIQCAEKTRWEWALWDEMPKEQRDARRNTEKQEVREKVQDCLEEAFPGKKMIIQIGIPPISGLFDDEKLLEIYWDGGQTM